MAAPRYTPEFRAEALKQIAEHGSVREVAKRLGMVEKTLYVWRRDARLGNEPLRTATKGGEDLRSENLRLKAELRRVTEERDILKKAAAYFAKASG
jgi:transposase